MALSSTVRLITPIRAGTSTSVLCSLLVLLMAVTSKPFYLVDSFTPPITTTTTTTTTTASTIQTSITSSNHQRYNPSHNFGHLGPLCAKSRGRDDGEAPGDDDNGEELIIQDQDWRAFRAKLVMSEKKDSSTSSSSATGTSSPPASPPSFTTSTSSTSLTTPTTNVDDGFDDLGDLDGIGSLFKDAFVESTTSSSITTTPSITSSTGASKSYMAADAMTPLDPSQWAYDSGDVIEKGAVILGGVEQDFGFGLRQQYFHKAAILVLDHSNTFTKGVLLNRPTDLTLEDDVNPGLQWRVWFGGDVEGLKAKHPDIVCIHSLKNEKATKASVPVMKDIQWTTFANAKVRTRTCYLLFSCYKPDLHFACIS
jgi:Uncharacterized ACR, COG1678